MGGIPSKEQHEINERLARIEQALHLTGSTTGGGAAIHGGAASVSSGGSPTAAGLQPQPPKKRGTHFNEDSPVHGSPAGANFRAARIAAMASESGDRSPATAAGGESPGRRSHGSVSPGAERPKFALPDGGANDSDVHAGSESPRGQPITAAGSKSAAKHERQQYFADMKATANWREVAKCPGVKCSWLAAACAALSFASGTTVRMEDVLRTNEMALHYVSMPAVTTAEVHDLLLEYVRSNRDLRDRLGVDVVHCDSEVLDEDVALGDDKGNGDRPPIPSLIHFRKAIAAELADESYSVHVLNYDPYLVQEAESKASEDEEALAELEEEEENNNANNLSGSSRQESSFVSKQPRAPRTAAQYGAKNMGAFAILTNYNAALHTVSLATPHLSPDGTYTLETHQCPLQTLYNACCVKDGYTKRTRGYVRVFRVDPEHVQKGMKPKHPVALVDGRQSRGMLSIALDISIAPHILGLGLLHEVVRSIIASDDNSAGGGSECVAVSAASSAGIELRGIPVTKICERLGLPVGTIVGSASRESLPTATVWYRRFLAAVGLEDKVDVGCVGVSRRDDSDDGAVNIEEEDFFAFLKDACNCKTAAVLLGFNVNIARNVRVVPEGQSPSHFALLMGYDAERGRVQLADVSVKKYRKIWHTSAELLYRATIGHGFIVATDKGNALANTFNGLSNAADLMGLARYGLALNRNSSSARAAAFEHPSKNYSMTVLAKGLNAVIGAPTVRVEDLIYGSGFHLSFMLSEHLPILATHSAAAYFCTYSLKDTIHPETVVCDPATFDKTKLEAELKAACDSTTTTTTNTGGGAASAVLVNYNGAGLNRFPAVWNGSFGGNLALVIGFDAKQGVVYLEDSHPEPFYRRWACPLDILAQCLQEVDPIADRARGYLVVRKGPNPLLQGSRHVDQRRAQSHHPFKNPVSSVASAIALALSEVLPGSAVSSEDVVYAGGKFSLTSLTSQVTPDDALAMAEDWTSQNPVSKKKLKVELVKDAAQWKDEAALINALAGPVPGKTVTLILYDATTVFAGIKEAGLSAGVINRATARLDIVVVDGSPIKHGDCWGRPAETVMRALHGLLHFTPVE